MDGQSDLTLEAVDGRRTVSAIEAEIGDEFTTNDRRRRWLDLAQFGFVLLESPDSTPASG